MCSQDAQDELPVIEQRQLCESYFGHVFARASETLREGVVMMHATVIARSAAMAEANCIIFLGF